MNPVDHPSSNPGGTVAELLSGSKRTAEEAKGSPAKKTKHRRITFDYTTNDTISRASGVEKAVDLTADQKEWGDLLDRIEDHVIRRTLIYYYLLVVVYKSGEEFVLDRTSHQYGKGSNGRHAAHSSILPNVKKVQPVDRLLHSVLTTGVSEEIEKELKDLGVAEDKIKQLDCNEKKEEVIEDIRKDEEWADKVVRNIYLYKTMNSTVELEKEVNQFDCLYENVIRPKALLILNRVSVEGLHPYEGLKLYIQEAHEFFMKCKEQIQYKKEKIAERDHLVAKLHRTEYRIKNSSSPEASDVQQVIYILIQLKDMQTHLRKVKEYSPTVPNDPVVACHHDLLEEIHQEIVRVKEEVKHCKDLTLLKGYAREWAALGKNSSLLHDALAATKKTECRNCLMSFLSKCEWSDYLVCKNPEVMTTKIKRFLAYMGPWEATPSEAYLRKLTVTHTSMLAQKDATILPKYRMLSGKMEDDVRIGLTEEELLEQQKNIRSYK